MRRILREPNNGANPILCRVVQTSPCRGRIGPCARSVGNRRPDIATVKEIPDTERRLLPRCGSGTELPVDLCRSIRSNRTDINTEPGSRTIGDGPLVGAQAADDL